MFVSRAFDILPAAQADDANEYTCTSAKTQAWKGESGAQQLKNASGSTRVRRHGARAAARSAITKRRQGKKSSETQSARNT